MDPIAVEITGLVSQLKRYNTAYHAGRPLVDDATYDAIYRRLRDLAEEHPELTPPFAVKFLDGVGDEAVSRQIPLPIKMMSLDNVYSHDEADRKKRAIEKEAMKKLPGKAVAWVEEVKVDGLAVCLFYQGGSLQFAATRGDGSVGEDITQAIQQIGDVPHTIPPSGSVVVPGEVYLLKDSLSRINERLPEGVSPYKTTRNAAAGILRQYEVDWKTEYLCFYAYDLIFLDTPQDVDTRDALDGFEFAVVPIKDPNKSLDDLPYDADGTVWKIYDKEVRQILGRTARAPRWAFAQKPVAEKKTTTFTGYHLQVGKSGAITPVALFDPVVIGGASLSRASLHNASIVAKLKLFPGDTILVERSGGVIPTVVQRVSPPEDFVRDALPQDVLKQGQFLLDICPSCKSPTTKQGATFFCRSVECAEKTKSWLTFFFSRSVYDVKGIGETLINHLVSDQGVTTVSGVVTKMKIKPKPMSLASFIFSLCIEGLGASKAEKIAQAVKTPQGLLTLTPETAEALFGKSVLTENLIEALQSEEMDKRISDILSTIMVLEHP